MKYCLLLALGMLPLLAFTQDLDNDDIPDNIEQAIIKQFAPEWRFHADSGSGSNQNNNEEHYPAAIEYLNEFDLKLRYQVNGVVHKSPINDIRQVHLMNRPGTSTPVTQGSFGDDVLRIEGYPEYLFGQPFSFPTYVHCYITPEGNISIGYLLFYPMDYKGEYCIGGYLFGNCIGVPVRRGKHRADWEGINIVVSGIDVNNINSVVEGQIEYVKFSGHGTKKIIKGDSPRFRTVHGTHPKIYITWGAHTPYPEPGNFTNYRVDIGLGINANWYDDYFQGGGVVVQSWNRPLLNMGEVSGAGQPMPGMEWINYRGIWGPDTQSSAAKSPPGPPGKSTWGHHANNYVTWEQAIQEEYSSEFWAGGFDGDCRSFLAAMYLPDPNYNCQNYVNRRTTCPSPASNIPFQRLRPTINATPSSGRVGVFPGTYRAEGLLNKPMTYRAIEGPVLIRQ